MSEDVGYMSDNLDWSCQSGSSSTGKTKSSNWLGLTSMIVGTLALGTALYAAFAPRNVVEQTSDKVRRALRRGAQETRTQAERAMEGISTAVSSHSSTAGSPTGVGMSGVPSSSHSHSH